MKNSNLRLQSVNLTLNLSANSLYLNKFYPVVRERIYYICGCFTPPPIIIKWKRSGILKSFKFCFVIYILNKGQGFHYFIIQRQVPLQLPCYDFWDVIYLNWKQNSSIILQIIQHLNKMYFIMRILETMKTISSFKIDFFPVTDS